MLTHNINITYYYKHKKNEKKFYHINLIKIYTI
jgi:hypothetical protein